MTSLKQYQKAIEDASEISSSLEREYDGLVFDRTAAARAAIVEELRPLQEKLIEARRALHAALAARDDFKEQQAQTGKGCPDPIGSKLILWERPGNGSRWTNRSEPYKPVGAGIVEVWTAGSLAPDNMSDYRLPKRGDFVIRILKKDGKPGRKFAKLNWQGYWMEGCWHREGVDPNTEKAKG